MKLLILGGTSDGKLLARQLHEHGIEVFYSIAGLVRQPDLPCEIISGGFSIRGGLSQYIVDNNITALLDATHPFATKMSQAASDVASQLNIPLWRYQRPDWVATLEDDWTFFDDWSELLRALASYQSIFLTQGQLSESMLAVLHQHRKAGQRFIHRTAVEPKHRIPDWMEWVQGIGPFSLDDELSLLKHHKIVAVVSKHSGGDLPNKIRASRALNLPTFLLNKPSNLGTIPYGNTFTDHELLTNALLKVAARTQG